MRNKRSEYKVTVCQVKEYSFQVGILCCDFTELRVTAIYFKIMICSWLSDAIWPENQIYSRGFLHVQHTVVGKQSLKKDNSLGKCIEFSESAA